jgi:hypothetical protein
VLTIVAVVVLLVQVGPIRELADVAADTAASIADIRGVARRPLIHAVGGLLVLLVVQVLGVYKPRGMTQYGQRRQRAQPSESNR